jgi:CYTH domain-containing protein
VASASEEGPGFGAVLAALVEDQVNALVARVGAISDAADVEGAHRARIEGKRLRYLLEPLRGYPRADASEAVSALKRLQDVMGALHDAHVLGEELGALLVDVSAKRARLLHVAVLSPGAEDSVRARLRGSPRPGLLALVRLVREGRDALFADLEREWRADGLGVLAGQVRGLADAVAARAGGRLEHERKFLLAALPPRAESVEAVEIVQGWLPGTRLRERIRRARRSGVDRYTRAVKRGSGGARLEAEEETTREVFETLWPLTEGKRIAKRRHRVRDGEHLWEIDVFTDRDLVLAEVELPARETELELPEWLRPLALRDVTDDPAFRNENLAAVPTATVSAPVQADSARDASPADPGEPPPAPAPG